MTTAPAKTSLRRAALMTLLLAGGLGLTALAALAWGRYQIPLTTMRELASLKLSQADIPPELTRPATVLFNIRLPRILLAFLVGGALSVSGAAYQSLFRNPMVAPDILGVSSGAGVGASLAIVWGWPTAALHLTAFLFGLGAVAIVLTVTRAVGRGGSLVVLILVGVVVSSLFSAVGSFIKYLNTDDQSLAVIVLWLMGSLAKAGAWINLPIMLGVTVLGILPLFLTRWQINTLAFGEEEARAMGVDVRRLRLIIVISATLLTASAVALCGLIGWVGLIIPHLARFLVGPNFRDLLPVTFLGGGLFMLLVDSVVRLALPGEMPVGIVTSVVGAPLFIYILCRSRKEWT
ncbi:MAG: iron ABC transporter permease [Candidatus Adiutrix sp.]|jgi:iron complex transport system permease protein|nr:iron ABC transporter permease [Candidatus Adiutrix sp.]